MSSILNTVKKAPASPGVYVFRNRHRTPLYIGKAANLCKRLSSYFRKNVGGKTRYLREETVTIDWLKTESEFDALLKEAELIKKYHPKYNVLLRDDKNYFYVGITKDKFPHLFITHQPVQNIHFIGPFTNGIAIKTVLKFLRRVFPYCTCRKPHLGKCLASQTGRCPGYCCFKNRMPSEREIREYRRNVKNITAVLLGRKRQIVHTLEKEMRLAANKQEFERAAKLRDRIGGLENIFGHARLLEIRLSAGLRPPKRLWPATAGSRISSDLSWPKIEKVLQTVLHTDKKIFRVEGYDISNISGTAATGSMVVFIDGVPTKAEYRKFRIRTIHQISDVDMLKEVIRRRLKHSEWKFPDLMLLDGGKPQLNSIYKIIRKRIALAALAKKEEELFIVGKSSPIRLRILPNLAAFFLQRVRDEAHRFARKYHHKLRQKALSPQNSL